MKSPLLPLTHGHLMSMLEPGLEFMSSDSYIPYFLSCTITFTLSFLLSLPSFGKPVMTLNSAVFSVAEHL